MTDEMNEIEFEIVKMSWLHRIAALIFGTWYTTTDESKNDEKTTAKIVYWGGVWYVVSVTSEKRGLK